MLISGKLIVSKYVAESITTIAGCFGQLRTKLLLLIVDAIKSFYQSTSFSTTKFSPAMSTESLRLLCAYPF